MMRAKNKKFTINKPHPGIVLGFLLIIHILFPRLLAANTDATSESNSIQLNQFIEQAKTMPRLYAAIVSVNSEIILEEYFNSSHINKLVNIKSTSKSIISALVGIAIKEGYIKDVNEPIMKYFGNLSEDDFDDEKNDITIADLLTMQSGLRPTSSRNYGAWVLSNDWIRFALSQPMEASPGTIMRYSTGNTHLLSAILTRATGKSTLEFAREKLTVPLGFKLAPWPTDPQGIYFGGNDMEMTARQMLKFGELYINDGQINGIQVVPVEWVRQSIEQHAISTRERGRYYGYGWWLKKMADYDASYAWGYGGQYIILVPELKLVVVTTSSSTPHRDRRSHRSSLTNLIEEYIIRPVAND